MPGNVTFSCLPVKKNTCELHCWGRIPGKIPGKKNTMSKLKPTQFCRPYFQKIFQFIPSSVKRWGMPQTHTLKLMWTFPTSLGIQSAYPQRWALTMTFRPTVCINQFLLHRETCKLKHPYLRKSQLASSWDFRIQKREFSIGSFGEQHTGSNSSQGNNWSLPETSHAYLRR